ncbi:MAG TPA: pitrilysin family protein [Caulobacteraceae bacterium]
MTAPRLHRLSNGVTVVCDPAPGYETLALSVVAGRGSRWEDAARSGWSHLLEHMVFKGAGGRTAREIVEVIEAAGGQINAATGHERTSFQVRALSGGLELAMAVTADIVQRPTLDAGDLIREKHVVGQEIAEAADTPDDQVFELAQTVAFADQPMGRPILGAPEALAPATPADMEAWRAAIYAPDRLVISVAGAVDEDELLRLAQAHFGAATAPPPFTPQAALFTGGDVAETRRLEQAHVVFMLPAPGLLDPDHFALRLFVEILGGGMSSRLFQEAREKLGLAYAIDAFFDAYDDTGVMGVYAGCAARDAGRLAQVTGEQIRAVAAGVSAAELARAKAQLKGFVFMGRESLLTRAEQAAAQALSFGRLMTSAEIAALIDVVTVEDLARVGARVLASGKVATSVLGTKAASGAGSRLRDALFG